MKIAHTVHMKTNYTLSITAAIVLCITYLSFPNAAFSQEYSAGDISKMRIDDILESPLHPEPTSPLTFFFTMGGGILLVFGGFWALRKLQRGAHTKHPSSRIKLLETKVLSPKTTLHLIKVDGNKVLIAESQVHAASVFEGKIEPFKACVVSKAESNAPQAENSTQNIEKPD